MRKFEYFYRVVYGTYRIYPANAQAAAVAALMGVKTFNPSQIADIGSLGFAMVAVPDPEAPIAAALGIPS